MGTPNRPEEENDDIILKFAGEVIGIGFDISKMDGLPNTGTFDTLPIFKRKDVSELRDQNKFSPNPGVREQEFDGSFQKTYSFTQHTKSFGLNFELGGGIPEKMEGKMDFGYGSKKTTSYAYDQAYINYYDKKLINHYQMIEPSTDTAFWELMDNFKMDVNKLLNEPEPPYEDFIKKYGTHCTVGVFVGGVRSAYGAINKEDYSSAKEEGMDFEADAKGQVEGVDISSKKGAKFKTSKKLSRQEVSITWSIYASGGKDAVENRSEWIDSLDTFPGVVRFDLLEIWELMTSARFPGVAEQDLLNLKEQLKNTANHYIQEDQSKFKILKSGDTVQFQILSTLKFAKGFMAMPDVHDHREALLAQGTRDDSKWKIYKVLDDQVVANGEPFKRGDSFLLVNENLNMLSYQRDYDDGRRHRITCHQDTLEGWKTMTSKDKNSQWVFQFDFPPLPEADDSKDVEIRSGDCINIVAKSRSKKRNLYVGIDKPMSETIVWVKEDDIRSPLNQWYVHVL